MSAEIIVNDIEKYPQIWNATHMLMWQNVKAFPNFRQPFYPLSSKEKRADSLSHDDNQYSRIGVLKNTACVKITYRNVKDEKPFGRDTILSQDEFPITTLSPDCRVVAFSYYHEMRLVLATDGIKFRLGSYEITVSRN